MPDPNIEVEVDSGIDQITLDIASYQDAITLEQIIPDIQVIEITTGISGVSAVNGLTGNARLTYETTLSYISPVNGIYEYPIAHELGYENIVLVVYNTDNEAVMVEYDCIDANNVTVKSLSNMNNFKVVVQR